MYGFNVGEFSLFGKPISMNYLKEIKQVVVSYGLHSPFVRERVKTWASSNKVTSLDWLQLVLVVLEDGLQLQWK